MSNSPDVNKAFVQIAGFILVGGIVSSFTVGGMSMFAALAMCYFMLVATNAIRRGENAQKKKAHK